MHITSNTNRFTESELSTKVNNLLKYITEIGDFVQVTTGEQVLIPISANLSDIENVVSIWTLTFVNNLVDDTRDHYLNEFDIEDITGIINDYLSELPYHCCNLRHLTSIPCTDTANPYEVIQVSISIEY